jgi:hypothetical protein
MVSIWYKAQGRKPEVCDRANNEREAAYLAHEYSMAFGVLPGQHRHGKDKVWAGRKDDEPVNHGVAS